MMLRIQKITDEKPVDLLIASPPRQAPRAFPRLSPEVRPVRPVRRLAARLVDMLLFTAVSGILLDLTWPPGIPSIWLPGIYLLGFVFYIFFDAAMIMAFGATPGKYLFGISVLSWDASKDYRVSLRQAMRRSLSIAVYGLGCGVPVINLLTLAASRRRLVRTGKTRWDEQEDLLVCPARPHPAKGIALFLCAALIPPLHTLIKANREIRKGGDVLNDPPTYYSALTEQTIGRVDEEPLTPARAASVSITAPAEIADAPENGPMTQPKAPQSLPPTISVAQLEQGELSRPGPAARRSRRPRPDHARELGRNSGEAKKVTPTAVDLPAKTLSSSAGRPDRLPGPEAEWRSTKHGSRTLSGRISGMPASHASWQQPGIPPMRDKAPARVAEAQLAPVAGQLTDASDSGNAPESPVIMWPEGNESAISVQPSSAGNSELPGKTALDTESTLPSRAHEEQETWRNALPATVSKATTPAEARPYAPVAAVHLEPANLDLEHTETSKEQGLASTEPMVPEGLPADASQDATISAQNDRLATDRATDLTINTDGSQTSARAE